jgi:hypothetical protein
MAEHQYAALNDVRRMAQSWDQDQLECRLYGHDWQPQRANQDRKTLLIAVVQVCPRCESERHQEINGRTGAVFAQWISYGDGYLCKGMGRIVGDGRNTLRLEAVTKIYKITKGKVEPHSGITREALQEELPITPVTPIKKAS